MLFNIAILFVALPTLTLGFPNLLVLRRYHHEATLVVEEGPLPTQALLAGVLNKDGTLKDAVKAIADDYGDLGGEKPIVKARKGIWGLLGWGEKRHLRVEEVTFLEEQDVFDEEGKVSTPKTGEDEEGWKLEM